MEKRRKFKTTPVVILFSIVIFGILFYCVYGLIDEIKSKRNEVKVLASLDLYEYSINENDPKYVKDTFDKLKKALSEEIVDEESYAKYVSQMFLADFYSLDAATNKNDVGGLQFIYKDSKDNFLKTAKNGIYHYVENNIYKKRKQDLPLVTDVEITNIEQKLYDSEKKTDGKAFYVEAKLTYEKDLNYPKTASVVLVHNNDKLEIVIVK